MNEKRVQPEGTQVTSVRPDIEGCAGVAWRVDLEKVRESEPKDGPGGRAARAAVAAWIIDSKWADPQHPYTFLGVVDLSLPGKDGESPTIRVQGATHELFVSPMPSSYVPVTDRMTKLRAAGPSFVAQFVAENNEAAIEVVREDVIDICTALLLPTDEGYAQWVHRYGDAMVEGDKDGGVQVDIKQFVVGEDGELTAVKGEMGDSLRTAIIRAVEAHSGRKGSLDGEFALPEDATVTPGCDCPTCELIREVRKAQGKPVLAHDGSVEIPAPDAVRH